MGREIRKLLGARGLVLDGLNSASCVDNEARALRLVYERDQSNKGARSTYFVVSN
jgi:hypothetical protein